MSQSVGITGYGGYVPRRRLSRKTIAEANAWINPGGVARAKGERSMANWDEDAITMSVEAGRDCLVTCDRASIDALYLASTTMPFAERLNASVVASALSLSEGVFAADVSGCQKAAMSALYAAYGAVASGIRKNAMVLASDHRKTRAGSPQEAQFGDGAAALTLGTENLIARLIGHASSTVDFVDHFRGEGEEFDYNWEERWIRDEGITKLLPPVIKDALDSAGVSGGEVDHFIFPTVFPRLDQGVAKACGIDPAKVRDNLGGNCGHTGAAHPLVMLAHCLETANPGERIVVAAFGQGADAVVIEVTDRISSFRPAKGISGHLSNRKEETSYMKWLAFNGLVEFEKGMRAEVDTKTAQTVAYRKRDMLFGLTGGKCSTCGTAQFPRTRICVNPNCGAVDTQEPYSFAEQTGKILSWSADYLTYSLEPPSHFGMITFEDGGRFMADITDVDVGSVESGDAVRMVFRIKDFDEKRGFRRYFWKAVPAAQTITAQAAE
ncbi:MAG: hydroxymethylglutaryl-CoA synthase family protein [Alphaproteobacteria bacterium]|nr:MAG: hydroxymethylglutaryl-CoA synthase family protein [Alphaproteobacteria bacterium]